MPWAPEPLRNAIRTRLALDSDSRAPAATRAEQATELWRRMSMQLSPVIGVHGLAVLYDHALHQTRRLFPWMGSEAGLEESDSAILRLHAALSAQPPEVAVEAIVALFAAIVELLASMIGQGLTQQLLIPVWDNAGQSPEESAP